MSHSEEGSQYNQMGGSYDSHQKQFFGDKLDWTREKLHKKLSNIQDKKVLDIGCGGGADVRWCEEQGAEVYGVDPSEKMCELARQATINPDHIQQGSYENLPFDDATFDIIFSRFSFHYLKGFIKAYEEMARVLKEGGELLMIVSHPTYDAVAVAESSDKSLVSVKLYDGKVTVQFPLHHLTDYFSPDFFKLFELKEIDETESVDAENPHQLPETLFYRAIKR